VTGNPVILPVIQENGILRMTGLLGVGASGLEKTARLGREDTTFLSGSFGFSRLTGSQLGNRGEQELRIGVQGTAEKVLSAGHLHNLSHVHDGDAIADVFYNPEIVRDEQVGETELVSQVHQEVQNLRLDGDVEGGDGFVGDNQLRMKGDSPGNPDSLALTSAELVGVTFRVL
jgi:hypothetical protein